MPVKWNLSLQVTSWLHSLYWSSLPDFTHTLKNLILPHSICGCSLLFPFYTNTFYLSLKGLCEAKKDALVNQAWPSHSRTKRHSSGGFRLRLVCSFAFSIAVCNLTAQTKHHSNESTALLRDLLCIMYSVYLTNILSVSSFIRFEVSLKHKIFISSKT